MTMEQRSNPLSLYHVQSNETSMEKVDRWTIHAVTLAFPPASRAKFACCHARAVHLAGVVPGARGVRPRAARRCLLGALRRAVPARGTAAWRCRAPLWRAPRVGERRAHSCAPARHEEQRSCEIRRLREHAVVELHRRRALEKIAPPALAPVVRDGV